MQDLISREAAIAAIEKAARNFREAEWASDRVITIGLSRAVLEVSAVPSPWVSVNDRLPEVSSENGHIFYMDDYSGYFGTFLACYKDEDVFKVEPLSFHVDWNNVPHWTVYNNVFCDFICPVLYWMELPAPPVS